MGTFYRVECYDVNKEKSLGGYETLEYYTIRL
jgi:hypothetical protein